MRVNNFQIGYFKVKYDRIQNVLHLSLSIYSDYFGPYINGVMMGFKLVGKLDIKYYVYLMLYLFTTRWDET